MHIIWQLSFNCEVHKTTEVVCVWRLQFCCCHRRVVLRFNRNFLSFTPINFKLHSARALSSPRRSVVRVRVDSSINGNSTVRCMQCKVSNSKNLAELFACHLSRKYENMKCAHILKVYFTSDWRGWLAVMSASLARGEAQPVPFQTLCFFCTSI